MPATPSSQRPLRPLAADRAEEIGHARPSSTAARRPHDPWYAIRTATALTRHYPHVLLVSWAANLLAALLLAALPALTLATGPGDRPVMHDMANGLDAWLWIEALMSPQAETHLAGTTPGADLSIGLNPVLLSVLLALLLVPVLAWLVGAFLQGGIVLTYHDAPEPFRWRRFWGACWHWWAPFLLLGVIQALAAMVFLLPLFAGAVVSFVTGSAVLGWLLLTAAFFANLLGLAIAERTRVLAVSADTRNVLASLRRAIRTLIHQPVPVAVLYLLAAAAGFLLQAIHRLILAPRIPLDTWLLVFLVGQLFFLARLAIRLARIAGTTVLALALYPAPVELVE